MAAKLLTCSWSSPRSSSSKLNDKGSDSAGKSFILPQFSPAISNELLSDPKYLDSIQGDKCSGDDDSAQTKVKFEWCFLEQTLAGQKDDLTLRLKPFASAWVEQALKECRKSLESDPAAGNSTLTEVVPVNTPGKEQLWLHLALCVNRDLPSDATAAVCTSKELAEQIADGFRKAQETRQGSPTRSVERHSVQPMTEEDIYTSFEELGINPYQARKLLGCRTDSLAGVAPIR